MRLEGLRRISPSCRSCFAKLDGGIVRRRLEPRAHVGPLCPILFSFVVPILPFEEWKVRGPPTWVDKRSPCWVGVPQQGAHVCGLRWHKKATFDTSRQYPKQRSPSCRSFYANKKPRQSQLLPGLKLRDTDRSACMKNRHRVSQVVSKLICSTGGQRKLLKHSAADRDQCGEAAGVVAPVRSSFVADQIKFLSQKHKT
jgi:hypothetical protein